MKIRIEMNNLKVTTDEGNFKVTGCNGNLYDLVGETECRLTRSELKKFADIDKIDETLEYQYHMEMGENWTDDGMNFVTKSQYDRFSDMFKEDFEEVEWEVEEQEEDEMEKKLWYAVMRDRADDGWDYGSFSRDKAIDMANRDHDCYYGSHIIAVIDANYDEDGNPTTDGVCIDEIEVPRYIYVKTYNSNAQVSVGGYTKSIDGEFFHDCDEDENIEDVKETLRWGFSDIDITEDEIDAIIEELGTWISVKSKQEV